MRWTRNVRALSSHPLTVRLAPWSAMKPLLKTYGESGAGTRTTRARFSADRSTPTISRRRVDVAGEHVPSVLVALAGRSLDVRARPVDQRAERRHPQGLVAGIEVDERALEAGDRLAAAVDGDARAELETGAQRLGKLDGIREGGDLADDRPDRKGPLNDAGEHGRSLAQTLSHRAWRAGRR